MFNLQFNAEFADNPIALPVEQKPAYSKAMENLLNQVTSNPNHIDGFGNILRQWIDNKTVTLQDVRSNPEIIAGIKKSLLMTDTATSFRNIRNSWLKTGVIDSDWANSLPEIQSKAREQIIRAAESSLLASAFKNMRNDWVKAEVITEEAANALAEVQAAAKESIVKAAKSSNWADDFSNVRRYWVDAGVVAESDVNTWSEIVKIAQEHILGALPNNFESTDHYNNIKRSWTSKGIAVD